MARPSQWDGRRRVGGYEADAGASLRRAGAGAICMRGIVKMFTIIIAAGLTAPAVAPALAAGSFIEGLSLDGLRITSMSVSVRPEYDQPGVLVIYEARVLNDSPQPFSGELAFQIPEGAPVPHACEITREGDHISRLPRIESVGTLRLVKWNIDRQLGPGDEYHAFVEFYYNPIEKVGDLKSLAYRFVPLVPTDRLDLTVVEPLNAAELRFSPQHTESRLASLDGRTFNVHLFQWENLLPGQAVQVDVSYRRADDRPSIAARSEPLASGASGGAARATRSGWGDPALVGLGLVLFGALGLFLYHGMRRPQGPSRLSSPGPARRQAISRAGAEKVAARAPAPAGSPLSADEERRLARQLLLQGRISEATYQQILKELEREGRPG